MSHGRDQELIARYEQLGREAVKGVLSREVAIFLGQGMYAWMLKNDNPHPHEISRRYLLVITALYLLSPTQFPWYYLWILPILAIHPRSSLLLLTALLPLYYLRYYFVAKGMVHVHDHFIVWLEFAPVWGLLIWEWRRGINLRVKT